MGLRSLLMAGLASLAPSFAAACPDEPVFAIAAAFESDGDTLVVALTNITAASINVPVHGQQHDLQDLGVSFTQADVVYTRLDVGTATPAGRPRRTLLVAPGETLVARLDLEWRIAALHCGVFDVHIDYFASDITLPAQLIVRPGCEWMPATVGPQPKWLDGSEQVRWPIEIGLAGLLLVGVWCVKRAGTPDGCVPCSLP